jgi:hypothetical protein
MAPPMPAPPPPPSARALASVTSRMVTSPLLAKKMRWVFWPSMVLPPPSMTSWLPGCGSRIGSVLGQGDVTRERDGVDRIAAGMGVIDGGNKLCFVARGVSGGSRRVVSASNVPISAVATRPRDSNGYCQP